MASIALNTSHSPNLQFIGPLKIQIRTAIEEGPFVDESYFALVQYEITDRNPPTMLPNNSVVIPADASGTMNVILESSVDLVTWTACLPGTYNPSDSRRFFRVRIESSAN